ncbi:HAMP domain-containing histidine kinase [Chitinophaga sedimenti]|uniref:sensor histidine kinase n=1 Tax=Chitinophaga sedimenti TaxID=2033606 RepID=UPI0020057616|nr:HAMP domain-containing sensor histidine kinase [Chitinophaga sedimenti]MCK7557228.1 HAMP domain-containing histidine kinase [Chitinophaga sedimenti]
MISFYHKRTQIKKEKELYEAKIEFFTNVTHEIRTPLTLIKGPVENLLEKTAEVPDIKPDVVTLERNTNRLIALITQILDFRQTETRGFSLTFSEVRIDKLLQEEFENFVPPATKKKLQYRLELPDLPITAWADEEALRKILSNLLSNAVKYAGTTATVILHPLSPEDLNFTIEVRNDGHLVSPEMREKIFEPFYRMKETSRQTGSGIGLSIARSLAELHQGYLYRIHRATE